MRAVQYNMRENAALFIPAPPCAVTDGAQLQAAKCIPARCTEAQLQAAKCFPARCTEVPTQQSLMGCASAPCVLVCHPLYHPHPADPADPLRITDQTRSLGLVVCRGTQVTVMCPEDDLKEIANPFAEEAAQG